MSSKSVTAVRIPPVTKEHIRKLHLAGLSQLAISEEARVCTHTVAAIVEELGLPKHKPGGRVKIRAVSVERSCMTCGKPFQSEWIGHRICHACKGTEAYRSSSIEFTG